MWAGRAFWSETWRSSVEKFITDVTATAMRDIAINTRAHPKLRIWLKIMYVAPCMVKQMMTERLYCSKLNVRPR